MKASLKTLRIGLTGSIGMGKSTIAKHFQRLGFLVFDADAAVHELYAENGEAVKKIAKVFPTAIKSNKVDRNQLSLLLAKEKDKYELLERIVHPLVLKKQQDFESNAENNKEILVVFDVPLLFENRMESNMDYTIVASASAENQRQRVLSRPNMTVEKFETILKRQMQDSEKRKRASFVIDTNHRSLAPARSQLASALSKIVEENPLLLRRWLLRGPPNLRDQNLASISEEQLIKKHFDLVIFALNDTLIPGEAPVVIAERKMNDFFKKELGKTSAERLKQLVGEAMNEIKRNDPLLSYDLAEMRREALYKTVASLGIQQNIVDEAMKIFLDARSNIDDYVFEDVNPTLNWLVSSGIKCVVLTNSEATLQKNSKFTSLFHGWFNAGSIGVKKPSWLNFYSALASGDSCASRTLYIAASTTEISASMKFGITSILLKRPGMSSSTIPNQVEPQKHLSVESLTSLKRELVNHILSKNRNHSAL